MKSILTASTVPVGSEMADYALGTDTQKEKREGFLGRAVTAGTGAAVNLATPGLLKMVPMRGGSILGNFGLKPQEVTRVNRKIADFIDYGSKQNAAREKLGIIADDLADSKKVAIEFAKKFGKKKEPISMKEAARFANGGSFKGMQEEKAEALARAISENEGNLGKGTLSFLTSGRDKFGEALLKEKATTPASALEESLPYLSSYIVNRMGRDGVARFVKNMFGRYTNRFSDEEE